MPRGACVLSAMLLTLAAGVAGAGEYDFFRLARYPEQGRLRPEVDLYEVTEPGGLCLARFNLPWLEGSP